MRKKLDRFVADASRDDEIIFMKDLRTKENHQGINPGGRRLETIPYEMARRSLDRSPEHTSPPPGQRAEQATSLMLVLYIEKASITADASRVWKGFLRPRTR
jgi:hypothetical protein